MGLVLCPVILLQERMRILQLDKILVLVIKCTKPLTYDKYVLFMLKQVVHAMQQQCLEVD